MMIINTKPETVCGGVRFIRQVCNQAGMKEIKKKKKTAGGCLSVLSRRFSAAFSKQLF